FWSEGILKEDLEKQAQEIKEKIKSIEFEEEATATELRRDIDNLVGLVKKKRCRCIC
ncbi:19279_t:CDS:2, partial [Gigaspora rosea]